MEPSFSELLLFEYDPETKRLFEKAAWAAQVFCQHQYRGCTGWEVLINIRIRYGTTWCADIGTYGAERQARREAYPVVAKIKVSPETASIQFDPHEAYVIAQDLESHP